MSAKPMLGGHDRGGAKVSVKPMLGGGGRGSR